LRLASAALLSSALSPGILATAAPFSFGVFGDTPYFAFEEVRLERVFAQMNAEALAFVIHVGDIKSSQDACDDAMYLKRKSLFQRIAHPFFITPGDNDWTDCHRPSNGRYHPLERLTYFRKVFYASNPELNIQRQSEQPQFAEYRENMRWTAGEVLFLTLHVVGSNNNFGREEAADREYRARSVANLHWLRESFALAKNAALRGIVVAMHADPLFEVPAHRHARTGYSDLVRFLREETRAFPGRVLLVHGDGHRYRLDQPLLEGAEAQPNFMRLEVFGSPTVGWIRVNVNAAQEGLFNLEPRR
jgi:hypothetical protein